MVHTVCTINLASHGVHFIGMISLYDIMAWYEYNIIILSVTCCFVLCCIALYCVDCESLYVTVLFCCVVYQTRMGRLKRSAVRVQLY